MSPARLTGTTSASGADTASPRKASPSSVMTTSAVHSIGACARRWGGVATRRLRSSTRIAAIAMNTAISEDAASKTFAAPGASAIASALRGASGSPCDRSPPSRNHGSVTTNASNQVTATIVRWAVFCRRPVGNASTMWMTRTRYSGVR
jgi:hypothetical protein